MTFYRWSLPQIISERPPSVSFEDSDQETNSELELTLAEVMDRSMVLEEMGLIAPPSSPTLYGASLQFSEHQEWSNVPWLLENRDDGNSSSEGTTEDTAFKKVSANYCQYLDTYPLSSQFAVCFQNHLNALQAQWLDENGDLLCSSDCNELEEALERMNFFDSSLAFLETVIPPGR